MTIPIKIEISPFDAGMAGEIFALFSREFTPTDRLMNTLYTEWLYLRNPNGPARVVMARAAGSMVGFMALIPIELQRRLVRRRAYYIVNVLVDRAQRGKKIFDKMIGLCAELAKADNAILIGHPNAAAESAWHRMEMDFQLELKPRVAIPKTYIKCTTRDIDDVKDLIVEFNSRYQHNESIHINISAEYVSWRFFDHPRNAYNIIACRSDKALARIIITKMIRFGVHMLIDCFPTRGSREELIGSAPFPTLVFTSGKCRSERGVNSMIPVPIGKTIRMFCTDFNDNVSRAESLFLGLSASDF